MIMNPYRIGRGLGYQRPSQVSHSKAPVEIMLLLNIVKEQKERRKANEEAAGGVERETLTHKGGYLKHLNNDWKGKRAGKLDAAKERRHTVHTGSKVERE